DALFRGRRLRSERGRGDHQQRNAHELGRGSDSRAVLGDPPRAQRQYRRQHADQLLRSAGHQLREHAMTKLRIILAGVVCGYLCASVLLWVLRAATTTIPGPLARSSQSASPMPTHDFESYADAVGLNALNGGSDFAGAYVDRGGI